MPEAPEQKGEQARATTISYLRQWGENPIPPTATATLIFAQHARPFRFVPMLLTPLFLGSSYMNLTGYETDAAGFNAALSGLYVFLARKKPYPFMKIWGVRGIVRTATMGLCAVNVVGGGIVYALNKREGNDE